MNLNPRLKSIAEFLDGDHHFVIPSYQRGYRWEERQIRDLLNDIYEFQDDIRKKKGDKSGEFYCIQPIVVLKRLDGKWELIDGQQRLTTILILLASLKSALKVLKLPTTFFTLEYETREKELLSSKAFLEQITSVFQTDKTNIDFYHMSNAFLSIEAWKEENDINVGDFCNTLLKVDFNGDWDAANNVRFIWYELDPNGDEANIAFTKYNQGKIDLTNSELIKAVFYLSSGTESEREKRSYQLKIGYEWDEIENALRGKELWNFLNPDKFYESHIEFIFELIATKYLHKTNLKINKSIDKLWSFYVFNDLITRNTNLDDSRFNNTRDFLWDEVKTYYRTFVEWCTSNVFYHTIGFLRQIEKNIEVIKSLSEENSKSNFIKKLKIIIQKHFNEVDFEQIGYEYDKKKAKEILLLFNVITTMNSRYSRFPFFRYKEEKWSLEHIHAQQSQELKNDKQRKSLLEEQKKYYSNNRRNDAVKLKIIDSLLCSEAMDVEVFDALQDEIFVEFSDSTAVHSLKNLALLNVPNNSSLNNNIFPIKRDLIKMLDSKGSFIPICTKNVFLKYYSQTVQQSVKWDKQDMIFYISEMKNTLSTYLIIKENEYTGI
ncbi:DUF262 domain-containing protein [Sphingobacterium oryzagri]|uniref:DUF262 domain-containing protein n=1 Tax=Sphingobacterium oryzagri TaxID=3025669 RepID=A0ABY7WJB3_9SPHI|nr:DUF262 domain-containing protein [Sphingobacterium sp. KACC 22765]WDF69605.1 DUF262 domain-containing protein [Sphingobacterium sp. KACC 22765]